MNVTLFDILAVFCWRIELQTNLISSLDYGCLESCQLPLLALCSVLLIAYGINSVVGMMCH